MPNSEPRPERVRQRGNNRDTYHPLRDQSKFMIPKDQSIPDVARDTRPFVYAAAKVNGKQTLRPTIGAGVPEVVSDFSFWRTSVGYQAQIRRK
jgi:hypothetical protein